MAEEYVHIEVSDEELDAAIAKADEALSKETDVLNRLGIVDATAEDTLMKIEEALFQSEELEWEKDRLDMYRLSLGETESIIDHLEPRLKSILASIPELRFITSTLAKIERYAGVTSPLMAIMITIPYLLNMVNRMRMDIEGMKRRQLDYERMIREAQGFTSREQYLEWQREYYRLLELSKKGESPL